MPGVCGNLMGIELHLSAWFLTPVLDPGEKKYLIQENNRKGEPTVMVVPYGPLGPYSRLVYLVNKYRVSLKNCVFIKKYYSE